MLWFVAALPPLWPAATTALFAGVSLAELAHWKRAHIWKQFGAGVRIGALLALLWILLDQAWLYEVFAVPETAYAGLAIGALWLQPLAKLSSPLENRLPLSHEREVDAFATEVMDDGEPLIDALARLTGENLSNPFLHPLYVAFHYDHPPIPDRVRYIQDLDGESTEGGDRLPAGTSGA